MSKYGRKRFSKEPHENRSRGEGLWKPVAMVAIGVALAVGLMGCTLEGVLTPFNAEDIPFEDGQTKSSDMGAVDDSPTVPDYDSIDDADFRPF